MDIKTAREFLHEISSPLGTLILTLESAIEEQKTKKDNECLKKLEKALKAAEQVSQMVQTRKKAIG